MKRSPSCKCCGCEVFTDGYDPPSDKWNVISGSLTSTTHNHLGADHPAIELTTGTLAIIEGRSIKRSGGMSARHYAPAGTAIALVFGYLDPDNYNFFEIGPGEIGKTTVYYERRDGTDTAIGEGGNLNQLDICWHYSDDHTHLLSSVAALGGFRGVSSLPGSEFGILSRQGSVKLWREQSGGFVDSDNWFTAFRSVGECTCTCPECAHNATLPMPYLIEATIFGVVDESPCHVLNGVQFCRCAGQCEWEWINNIVSSPGVPDRYIYSRVQLLLVSDEYHLVFTVGQAVWSRNLGASKPQLWTIDITLSSADLVSNDEPCDLSTATIRITAQEAPGMVI